MHQLPVRKNNLLEKKADVGTDPGNQHEQPLFFPEAVTKMAAAEPEEKSGDTDGKQKGLKCDFSAENKKQCCKNNKHVDHPFVRVYVLYNEEEKNV